MLIIGYFIVLQIKMGYNEDKFSLDTCYFFT
jgi:hypothetical protein